MCRWISYLGPPVRVSSITIDTPHSLIDQSKNARLGTETNGDGYGLGWYDSANRPYIYHDTSPAWSDANLREIASYVETTNFFAHVRASSGTAVQETNCHPFRHNKWLWMHNGAVSNFLEVKRQLILGIDHKLFPYVLGSTDSEILFYLALTFGLDSDPISAVEKMAAYVENCVCTNDSGPTVRMTIAVTDGFSTWAFRYASSGPQPTLFQSSDTATLRMLNPDNENWLGVAHNACLVVSEPLTELKGDWNELPQNSYVCMKPQSTTSGLFDPISASKT